MNNSIQPITYSSNDAPATQAEEVNQIIGTAGNDTLEAYTTRNIANLIQGLGGNDRLTGGFGKDTLDGGLGDDTLSGDPRGGYGDTFIFGKGSGHDVIHPLGSPLYRDADSVYVDHIQLDANVKPSDVKVTGSGEGIILSIVNTNDTLTIENYYSYAFWGGAGIGFSVIHFADGTVWNFDDVNRMFFNGALGLDRVIDTKGSDSIQGQSGNDAIFSIRGGNDTLLGGAGNDFLIESSGNSSLSGGDGDDFMDASGGNDRLDGGSGNDTLKGGYNSIDGSINGPVIWGNDSLMGGDGNDSLDGGGGNDLLDGGYGTDTLDGGIGDDTLIGGSSQNGGDTYLFGKGGGHDVIRGAGTGTPRAPYGQAVDHINLDSTVKPEDVRITKGDGSSLILTIVGTNDSLTIEDYYYNTTKAGANFSLIHFANGTTWGYDDINRMFFGGTTGNDKLLDARTSDLIQGQSGNDNIYSTQGGNDTLQGGDGDDFITEASGNSDLFGGQGNDTLQASEGTDRLYGGDGNDQLQEGLFELGWILNKPEDVLLDGGAGNDTLSGGASYNTYVFGKGYGQDVVNTYQAQKNTVVLNADVKASDIQLKRVGDSLLLKINDTTDSLVVNGFFINEATSGRQLDLIKFADGTQWGLNTIKSMVLAASANADTLTGYASDDRINGLAGNDLIRGRSGNDLLEGGDGNDSLYGDAGTDSLYGGIGNDRLDGGDGNDRLSASDGDDTIVGGAGNDTLYGGAGADTIVFGHGSGQDLIGSTGAAPGAAGRADTVRLDADVTSNEVALQRDADSNDLLLKISGSTDSLRIADYFAGHAKGVQYASIEFSGLQQSWDFAEVSRRLNAPAALQTQTDGLIAAMAAFAPAAGGAEVVNTGVRLDAVLVASMG